MKSYGGIASVVDEKLKFRRIGMAIAAVTVMTAWQSKVQSPQGATAPVAPLAFEVASVKSVPPPIPSGGGPWIVTHGTIQGRNRLCPRYDRLGVHVLAAQVRGGPDWIDREPYYVDARAENPEAGPEQIRAMLRTLLTDRFKLAVHRETRQG